MLAKLLLEIIDYYNFEEADNEVRRGKLNNPSYVSFCRRKQEFFTKAPTAIKQRTYRPGALYQKTIYEPKERNLLIPLIDDRVVHHAIVRIEKPIMEKHFHWGSYACREGKEYIEVKFKNEEGNDCTLFYDRDKKNPNRYPNNLSTAQAMKFVRADAEAKIEGSIPSVIFHEGRGVLSAVRGYQADIRSALGKWGQDFYIVSLDFKGFYASIDHNILFFLYARLIRVASVLWLNRQIIDCCEEGVPLGFPTSQDAGNLMGSCVDYFVTDVKGHKYYKRYADDIRILVHTREEAKALLYAIDEFCTILKLTLSPKKTKITHWSGRDTFCGYVVCPHKLLPKQSTVNRAHRRLNKKLRLFEEGKISAQQLKDSALPHLAYRSHTAEPNDELCEKCIKIALEHGAK